MSKLAFFEVRLKRIILLFYSKVKTLTFESTKSNLSSFDDIKFVICL